MDNEELSVLKDIQFRKKKEKEEVEDSDCNELIDNIIAYYVKQDTKDYKAYRIMKEALRMLIGKYVN